jgi:hypothetical protein
MPSMTTAAATKAGTRAGDSPLLTTAARLLFTGLFSTYTGRLVGDQTGQTASEAVLGKEPFVGRNTSPQ